MKSTGYLKTAKRFVTSRGLVGIALLLLVSFKPAYSWNTGDAPVNGPVQNKIAVVGILSFQDETDSGAPPELGRKIAQQLKQRLAVSFNDVVPKSLSSDAALSVEQAVAMGRQNAVQFVVRGGLLALTMDNQSNVNARLYAEIISVDSGVVSVVSAEGAGAGGGGASPGGIQWSTIDLSGASFTSSAPGAALAAAIDSLANSLHQVIASPPADGAAAASGSSSETVESTPSADTAAAESDDELRQLIAQAEQIVANGSGDTDRLLPVSSALDKLKLALASRASVIENGADPTNSDQEIAVAKTELQSAVTVVTEQSGSSSGNSEEATPTGEKKSLLGKIDQRASEALGLLQKIQELRAGIRGVKDGVSSDGGTGQTEDVSGVVMQEGEAVGGVEVVDQASGISAITGPDGSYVLKALPSGKLANLMLKKNGKQMGKGQIDVMRGRVADFEIKKNMAPNASALRVVPSATVLKGSSKGATGSLKGTAKDQAGKPLPRALVSLNGPLVKNEAVARTDSAGRYRFLNVPAGDYLVTIQKSGSKPVSTRVSVKPNVAVEVQSQLTTMPQSPAGNRQRAIVGGSSKPLPPGGVNPIVISRDRALNGVTAPPDPAKGTGSSIRPTALPKGSLSGQVIDASNRKPISGATVSITGRRVKTDLSGRFEFEDLSPGAYRVKVTSNGFSEDEQAVTIRAGATSRDQFALKPLEDKRMVRVVPEAGRVTTPVRFGQVRGRVVDAASGAPIPGAVVAVAGQQRAVTGRDGSYHLNALPPGSHQVSVSRAGFIEKRTSFTIRAGEVTDASFRLAAMTRRPNQ